MVYSHIVDDTPPNIQSSCLPAKIFSVVSRSLWNDVRKLHRCNHAKLAFRCDRLEYSDPPAMSLTTNEPADSAQDNEVDTSGSSHVDDASEHNGSGFASEADDLEEDSVIDDFEHLRQAVTLQLSGHTSSSSHDLTLVNCIKLIAESPENASHQLCYWVELPISSTCSTGLQCKPLQIRYIQSKKPDDEELTHDLAVLTAAGISALLHCLCLPKSLRKLGNYWKIRSGFDTGPGRGPYSGMAIGQFSAHLHHLANRSMYCEPGFVGDTRDIPRVLRLDIFQIGYGAKPTIDTFYDDQLEWACLTERFLLDDRFACSPSVCPYHGQDLGSRDIARDRQ